MELNFAAGSDLNGILEKLRRAQEAFEAGEHHRLFRGELIEDLPAGLRRRFIETGELDGEPERLGGKRRPRKERSPRASRGERRARP